MSQHISESLRAYIEANGGVITETRQGHSVDFPEQDVEVAEAERTAAAAEVEAAVERAREYRTPCIRLWEERGEGWYAAASRETHPGFWWRCQIDERTGQPIRCLCDASVVCHHLGAACADWRLRHEYEANGEATLQAWEETVAIVQAHRPSAPVEETWT